jgi:hypothetical protein
MEIEYYGANRLAFSTKEALLIVDPVVPGVKLSHKKANIIALTHPQDVEAEEGQLLIDSPGEYESKQISIKGISARAHMDEEELHSATIFRIDTADIRVAVVGHIYPDLDDSQLEALGMVDVLVIPVGGMGYTLDAEGAAKIIRAVNPKVVIPTHYAEKGVTFEVPQNDLKLFIDELGALTQKEDKYKIKAGEFPEQLTVVVLSRSA